MASHDDPQVDDQLANSEEYMLLLYLCMSVLQHRLRPLCSSSCSIPTAPGTHVCSQELMYVNSLRNLKLHLHVWEPIGHQLGSTATRRGQLCP